VNFVLLLVAISDLEFAESVFMGALVGVIQCVWKPRRRPTTLQVLFNGACVLLSTAAAFFVCRQALAGALAHSPVALLAVASLILYLCNTLMVSAILALVSRKPLGNVWKTCYFWYFWSCPYYLVGAVVAGLMTATSHIAGWQMSLAVLPLMAMVYVLSNPCAPGRFGALGIISGKHALLVAAVAPIGNAGCLLLQKGLGLYKFGRALVRGLSLGDEMSLFIP
jgi:hypothetical protein